MSENEKKTVTEEEKSVIGQVNEAAAETEQVTEKPAEKPAKEKKPKKSGKNPFKSKKFKHGSLSVVFTVIFVTAIVLVNVIFNLLLDRFDIKADLTEGGIFTAGKEISEFAGLDSSKVHFYFTSDEETLENADKIYKQSVELVKQLVAANKGYDVSFVDLLKTPSFAEEHGVSKEGSLLVECEDTGRSKSFDIYNDFKRYVMSDGSSYSASDQQLQMMMMYGYKYTGETSVAEQELLSALVSVTKVNPVKAAVTSGFGESENKALTELLEKNSYVVEKLDIDLAAEIPRDYDILIVNAPTMDYSEDAITAIDEWLSNGGLYGKSLVYFACFSQPVSTPKLNAYLAEWGIQVGDSFALQMDSNYAYSSYYGLPLYQRAEIVTDTDYYGAMQLGDNTSFRVNGTRPVFKLWDQRTNYENTTIVRTYGDNCLLLPFDADESWKESDAEKGQFDILTEAAKIRFETNSSVPIRSRIIVGGSETIFSEYFLSATNYNNAEVAVAIFNTLSGNTDKQITITPKSFTATTYEIDSAQQAGIGLTFAVIIPAAIIILGIVVWVRRRHL